MSNTNYNISYFFLVFVQVSSNKLKVMVSFGCYFDKKSPTSYHSFCLRSSLIWTTNCLRVEENHCLQVLTQRHISLHSKRLFPGSNTRHVTFPQTQQHAWFDLNYFVLLRAVCFSLQEFWKNRSMKMTTKLHRKRKGSIIHVPTYVSTSWLSVLK
jgi:hypothetical protein